MTNVDEKSGGPVGGAPDDGPLDAEALADRILSGRLGVDAGPVRGADAAKSARPVSGQGTAARRRARVVTPFDRKRLDPGVVEAAEAEARKADARRALAEALAERILRR